MRKGGNTISYAAPEAGCGDADCGSCGCSAPVASCGDDSCSFCVLPMQGGFVAFVAVPGAVLVIAVGHTVVAAMIRCE